MPKRKKPELTIHNCHSCGTKLVPPRDEHGQYAVICPYCESGPVEPVGDELPFGTPEQMVVDLADLPSRDLQDILRYAATMARGAGMKRYEVKVGHRELKILSV